MFRRRATRVWVVIMGNAWPRQVERVCSSAKSAEQFAAGMNCHAISGCELWWVEEWTVSP